MQPLLVRAAGCIRPAQGKAGANFREMTEERLHEDSGVRSGNELLVAGWVEVLNQILFLGETIGFERSEMRVNVGCPTGDGTGLFLVIREAVVQVFGLPEILGHPIPSRVFLTEYVVAGLFGKLRADWVDVMSVGFPGLAGPVAGRSIAHVLVDG